VEAFLDTQKIPDWEGTADPVRIAVLDTGVRWDNAFMRQNDSRIVAENFVVDGGLDDIDGHGTDVIGILLRMTRNATVYSAKIADTRANPDLNAIEEVCVPLNNLGVWANYSQAIDYAINEWRVHIISMSFGFDETHEGVRRALQRAHSANIIMFAAGHNDGANRPIAFPANSPLVIAVGAANAYGKDSSFSPAPPNKDYYFTAFGENIYNFGREKSGTSFATPVAAGIAALVMDYVNCLTNEDAVTSIPSWMVAQGRR
jgi:subtilisin family serine protease